jgi:hypothetical protein
MEAGDVLYLSSSLEDDLPEICFLEDMLEEAQDAMDEKDLGRPIDLPNLDWAGIGSSSGVIDVLLKKIAPHIRGRIEAVLLYDSGDMQGVAIENGVGSLPAVKLVLDYSRGEDFE